MSNPNQLSQGFDKSYVDMSDAPGSDIPFDDLFPPEGTPAAQPQVAQGNAPQNAPQAPSTPTLPFLKAGDSVYNTSEDAARGLEHKDALVSRYRTYLAEQGIDPDKLEPVARPSAPQATPPDARSPYKYFDSDQLVDELSSALGRKDRKAYEAILREYSTEVFNSQLQPFLPLISEAARQRAVRQVSEEIPDFGTFYGSEDFKKVRDTMPILKDALYIGENNPQQAEKLRELYQLAYLVNKGLKSGQAPQTPNPVAAQPVNPPSMRPTTSPSTMTPPTPTNVNPADWTTNREARKQLVKDAEARGMKDLDWSKVGF